MCKSGRPDDDGFQQSKFKIKNLDEMEETLYMLKASFSSLKRSKMRSRILTYYKETWEEWNLLFKNVCTEKKSELTVCGRITDLFQLTMHMIQP